MSRAFDLNGFTSIFIDGEISDGRFGMSRKLRGGGRKTFR